MRSWRNKILRKRENLFLLSRDYTVWTKLSDARCKKLKMTGLEDKSLIQSHLVCYMLSYVGRDSSVEIAIRYGCMSRVSNPGTDKTFRTRHDRPWGLPRLLYKGYRVLFLRGETARIWWWPSTPSSSEAKECTSSSKPPAHLQGLSSKVKFTVHCSTILFYVFCVYGVLYVIAS